MALCFPSYQLRKHNPRFRRMAGQYIMSIVSDALLQFGSSGGPMLEASSGKVVGINTLRHELADPLAHRLEVWSRHPSAAAFPLVRDLVEYSLKYTYVGLHHAVSVEYARQDPAWPAQQGGTT